MNDFTKEELKYLYEAAETEVKYFNDGHIGHSVLLKLQSMIDNYCEHEWRSSAIDAIYCPHCQKHVECKL